MACLSCKKNSEFGPQFKELNQEETKIKNEFSYAYILNEGNFTYGNASISRIDSNGTVQNHYFKNSNDGKAIGDIAQSMTNIGDTGYIVMNASAQIHQVLLPSFKLIKSKEVGNSPRYMMSIGQNKILLSDLGSGNIKILNARNLDFLGSIKAKGWNEEMAIDEKYIYICNADNNKLLILDRNNQQMISEVSVGQRPQSLALDKRGGLWVLCDGGYDKNTRSNASLHLIEPAEKKITFTYTFPEVASSPSRLRMDIKRDKLYFINGGVYSFEANLASNKPELVIARDGRNFYGLNISPDGNVWVSDARDFILPGRIFIYSSSGILKNDFEVGIIPQHILFH